MPLISLVKQLREHIAKEDNIIYPMVLEFVDDKEWKTLKQRCDQIGYCSFTEIEK